MATTMTSMTMNSSSSSPLKSSRDRDTGYKSRRTNYASKRTTTEQSSSTYDSPTTTMTTNDSLSERLTTTRESRQMSGEVSGEVSGESSGDLLKNRKSSSSREKLPRKESYNDTMSIKESTKDLTQESTKDPTLTSKQSTSEFSKNGLKKASPPTRKVKGCHAWTRPSSHDSTGQHVHALE